MEFLAGILRFYSVCFSSHREGVYSDFQDGMLIFNENRCSVHQLMGYDSKSIAI